MRALLFFLIVITFYASGQKQGNIWYFGNYAGVDFNSGSPIALLDGQLTYPGSEIHNEGTAVISDSLGVLLCYSDGMNVWNKNHQIMQNGTGLLGNASSTQSSIFVPDPSNPNQYFYLFTVSSGFCCGGSINDGLRYSKLDMCLDNSLGGIIAVEKNIKLVDSVAEKIAVTRHANGIDYWILTHKFYSNEFWALHLSNNGIIDTVVTAIGSTHSGNIAGSQGQLKFSPNGQRIAISASNGLDLLEVFDFDKTTGIVSNPLSLYKPNNNNSSIYGVEFSPDNSKLYVSGIGSMGTFHAFLAQYDLNAGGGNLLAINASMTEIYHNTTGIIGGKGLQLATDNKIYWVSLNVNNPYGTLAVINNPNIPGTGCNYQDQVVSLGGRQGSFSLPSFIAGFDYSNTLTYCHSTSINETYLETFVTIHPNPLHYSSTLQTKEELKNAKLIIYNSYGQEVKTKQNISGNTIVLSRENLTSGLYFVHLIQNNQLIAANKLIIND